MSRNRTERNNTNVEETEVFTGEVVEEKTGETEEKEKKEKVITRTIATGHSFNLYRVTDNGGMELLKSNIVLPTKRITDKLLKNVMKEEEVTGNCKLVYIHSIEKKYEMTVEDFMKYAKVVE